MTETSHVLPPKTGYSTSIRKGQHLRVVDLEGKQTVDMVLFNSNNFRERISTSYSRTRYIPQAGATYVKRDHLTVGDTLMSTICQPMMTILEETPEPKGVHSLHNRMCNTWNYVAYGLEPRDGCLEILSHAVEQYSIAPEEIPDSMDIFMNCHHDCARNCWVTDEPVSRAGDYIEFRAEMDCLAAFSNCPQDVLNACNGYHCTPVRIDIFG